MKNRDKCIFEGSFYKYGICVSSIFYDSRYIFIRYSSSSICFFFSFPGIQLHFLSVSNPFSSRSTLLFFQCSNVQSSGSFSTFFSKMLFSHYQTTMTTISYNADIQHACACFENIKTDADDTKICKSNRQLQCKNYNIMIVFQFSLQVVYHTEQHRVIKFLCTTEQHKKN